MEVRFRTELPSPEQARKLGKRYIGGKQVFNLRIGAEYLVYAIDADAEIPWVRVLDEQGQLVPVPLCLFDLLDPRVSSLWQAGLGPEGQLYLWPPPFFRPYYFEDLLNRVEDAVSELRRVTAALKRESV